MIDLVNDKPLVTGETSEQSSVSFVKKGIDLQRSYLQIMKLSDIDKSVGEAVKEVKDKFDNKVFAFDGVNYELRCGQPKAELHFTHKETKANAGVTVSVGNSDINKCGTPVSLPENEIQAMRATHVSLGSYTNGK